MIYSNEVEENASPYFWTKEIVQMEKPLKITEAELVSGGSTEPVDDKFPTKVTLPIAKLLKPKDGKDVSSKIEF